jgi:hypothetical protein
MNESKHTPGPWRDGQDGNMRVYGPDGMGEHSGLIAVVYKGRANAQLIAAAPDLLEAMKGIVHFSDAVAFRTDPLSKALRQWIYAGEAAIAKAEGRS